MAGIEVEGEETSASLKQSLDIMGNCIIETLVAAEQYMPPDKFKELKDSLASQGFEFFVASTDVGVQQGNGTKQ